jgi:chromosome segregation ATPase
MTQAIIVALIGGLLGGGAIAALITSLSNRGKVKAEVGSLWVKTANDLIVPLEKRLNELQSDNETRDKIIRHQSDCYDRLEAKYDQVMFELRAVRADRDNLLAERIIYQKRLDDQALIIVSQVARIKDLECRVAELEREAALLRDIVRKYEVAKHDTDDTDGTVKPTA